MSLLPTQVTTSPTYREDVRTVATAVPPGQPDGQPTAFSRGGYVKDPPRLPVPPEVPGGFSAPEGTNGAGELPPFVEPEPPVEFDPYPTVPRAMPGASIDPASPHCGNFLVGRTSTVTLQVALTASLPSGVSRDETSRNLHVSAAGTILENIDMRGGWTVSFASGANDCTIQQCIFDNALKAAPYYAVIDAYNNGPSGLAVVSNSFLGLKTGSFEASLVAWVSVGAEPIDFRWNVSMHPPGDHFKTEGGLIFQNYCYGGGTTPEAHFDFVQVQQLNAPLTIEGNVFNGLGDGDTNGATNIVRAVPNDTSQGVKTHAIECFDNVMLGMGHQIENDNSHYTVAAYHGNWQDDWAYSPHQIVATASVTYYDNKVLSTGEPIPDVVL